MTVFLTPHQGAVIVQARLEAPGGVLGDVVRRVAPGEFFHGWGYDDLLRLGEGKHEIATKAENQADAGR